jgi:hypothetical protein
LTELVNNQLLDCLFGGRPIVPPPTLYLGLSLGRSRKDGRVCEPSDVAYARVAVPNTPEHFPPASSGAKSNASAIIFPSPSSVWGPIQSVFVADSPTGGNVLATADLPKSRAFEVGGPVPRIAVGALFFLHS